MKLETFHLEVRSAKWAKPPLRHFDLDDRPYTILGAVKGDVEYREPNPMGPRSYFAKLLVKDTDRNQYLINTEDNCPVPIAQGSQDEMIGCQYQTWYPGKRLYVARLRTELVDADKILWDSQAKCYYIVQN